MTQLREYLLILRRRWPIVLLLPLLAGGLSLALVLRQAPRYQSGARMMIVRSPLAADDATTLPNLNDGSIWTTTEYILDDLPLVVNSVAFAQDVQAALAAEGYQMAPAAIQGGLSVEVTHRSVYLSATADTPELAQALSRNSVLAIREGGLKYWGRTTAGGLEVSVLDPPGAAGAIGGLRGALRDLLLRTVLGFVAGVGLAFLLHYLDDRLRSVHQAEQWTGARVVGVIPPEGSSGR